MPLYSFVNTENEEETVDVFFHMNDEKKYFGPDGKEWRRVWTKPFASIDTQIDPFSAKEFVEKTGKKSDTVGSLLDRSSELSEIRKQKAGRDEVREKYIADYKKKTGKDFIDTHTPKVIEHNGFKVSMTRN